MIIRRLSGYLNTLSTNGEPCNGRFAYIACALDPTKIPEIAVGSLPLPALAWRPPVCGVVRMPPFWSPPSNGTLAAADSCPLPGGVGLAVTHLHYGIGRCY